MSVQLNPSNQLGFNRPLTQIVRRTLTVTNHNDQPVAFKVKTTAPRLYCVRPNSGVIEPGDTVDVAVLLQAMREDPPLATKCKDKFLVQSMVIPHDRLSRTPQEMWQFDEDEKQPQIHQQKIKVVYLPAENEVLTEEEIGHPSMMTEGESHFTRYEEADRSSRSPPPPVPTASKSKPESERTPPPVRATPVSPPSPVPVPAPAPVFAPPRTAYSPAPAPPSKPRAPSPTPSPPPREHRPISPGMDYTEAEEVITSSMTIEPLREEKPPTPQVVNINVVTPSQPPTPGPAPVQDPINAAQDAAFADLNQRYSEAQIEINRLRGLLASIPPAGTLRRRSGGGKVQSEDGSTVLGDDVSEDFIIEQEGSGEQLVVQSEGVPLQLVVLIALGVFVTTYLFF
ncbi:Vesicle-associated membrane protein-associated protein C16G5,05c OS=Schizosaccharomyces pombe (strain 972 / ATCC 24843) GN=SPBC16G5.05c PE=1 SV=1 [Rhizoctonia solani AG-1 IB]|uniref:Vesicle-associated membrane protein-associated protein C16G5,05c n=1 Tax=Thanatephorus cucumeris (strain AG1-IB / isolate 7/3/14) TaxID=1108050 RepID=A0A0B7FL71_THACB|nr:Vesicle-associated membrane protein-associated protein C16G5,05c OS=Schizosaccharomyces pombe (strain 972 / ATCC 24843) GN=SPBC16G5.05c PE=1 SV=1 [Rhizoctonia solani AG-1 IB]